MKEILFVLINLLVITVLGFSLWGAYDSFFVTKMYGFTVFFSAHFIALLSLLVYEYNGGEKCN